MGTAASVEHTSRGTGLSSIAFDRVAATLGLMLLSPVYLIAAIAVAVNDGLPVFFRQPRVGRWGKPFRLVKFRSMYLSHNGAEITASLDPRVTKVGRFLRKHKLDELPQLWNVVRGDMSLIGPRPEVPAYVDRGDVMWQRILRVRPGITDLASLVYRDEEQVLARAKDPDRYYREHVLPDKLRLNLLYTQTRSFGTDLRLLFWTAWHSLFPGQFNPDLVLKRFSARSADLGGG